MASAPLLWCQLKIPTVWGCEVVVPSSLRRGKVDVCGTSQQQDNLKVLHIKYKKARGQIVKATEDDAKRRI